MEAAIITKHLLILCCYGGSPFVDLQLPDQPPLKHKSTHALDPTDWIAVDTSGSELNSTFYQLNSTKPIVNVPDGVPIEKCDLFNLTFTNVEDENLFDRYKGRIECRCPPSRRGASCEYDAQLTTERPLKTSFFPILVIAFALGSLAAVISLLLMMMKCGFCDCFGPFRSPFAKDDLDEPLDENTLNRCLELLRAHEQRTTIKQNEHSRPLISTVSNGRAPYNPNMGGTSSVRPQPHAHSPPPSYRSLNGSFEDLSQNNQRQRTNAN